jgi:hypothetical protein
MKFTVVWKAPAKVRLAEIWLAADDRAAVTRAANRLDELLKADPFAQGESREAEFRVAFEKPLAIKFAVSQSDLMVAIAEVWAIKR